MNHSGPLMHVVGTRPNFMKAAPVVAACRDRNLGTALVHTGQHYDRALSQVFFDDLGMPTPDLHLGVGSGSHASQTASLLTALEEAMDSTGPRAVVVYGDVNSTLAAALVAAKKEVPIAHVEAGLRSFDRSMPEEVNRVVTDVLSQSWFVTAPEGVANLDAEGIRGRRVRLVGNPMIDTLLRFRPVLDSAGVVARLDIQPPYAVVTLHRPANVDDPVRLRDIAAALREVAATLRLVIPAHPRSRRPLEEAGLVSTASISVIEPLGYLEFMALVSGAALVVTDSGGIQEETSVLGIPCLTVRPNTERPITVTAGTNRLVTPEELAAAAATALGRSWSPASIPLWDGSAATRIVDGLGADFY
jgi:UDP-N-acetylglucosamine 2-epimerase (non-hydrolysing)